MTEELQSPINPPTPSVRSIASEVRTLYTSRPRTTRVLNRGLRVNPVLNRIVQEMGGVGDIINRRGTTEIRRRIETESLLNTQNAVIMDSIVGGDIDTAPSLQELDRTGQSTLGYVGYVRTIKLKQSTCCNKITYDIGKLSEQTKEQTTSIKVDIVAKLTADFSELKRYIEIKAAEITAAIEQAKNDIITKLESLELTLHELKSSLETYTEQVTAIITENFNTFIDTVKELLNSFLTEIQSQIEAFLQTIKDFIIEQNQAQTQNILEALDEKISAIETKIDQVEESLTQKIAAVQTQVEAQSERIGVLDASLTALGVAQEASFVVTDGLITQSAAELEVTMGAVETSVLMESSSIKGKIATETQKITQDVDDTTNKIKGQVEDCCAELRGTIATAKKEIKKKIEDEIKPLPEKVSNETCLSIVGEAYTKWDSTVSYYPSVTFIFTEITESNNPRKSQIKIRLPKAGKDLTNQDIQELRQNIQAQGQLGYRYGKVRGNYVAATKSFKTTIYASSQEEVQTILTKSRLKKATKRPFFNTIVK